jgi:hypothetical protein
MYNESDMHTGCESCGNSITTYYTNNVGFYCDRCIEEHHQSEAILKKDWSIFSEKLAAYIYRADDGNLKLSSIKYFKSSYFKTFLLFNKVDRTYMIRKAISAIRVMKSYRTWDNSYSDQQEYITREILKLLLKNRR